MTEAFAFTPVFICVFGRSPNPWFNSREVSMVKTPIRSKLWAIAEGYIPSWSHGPQPEMLSHETACILNASDQTAHIEITVYYKNRDPSGPYTVTVQPCRTLHVRFNDLQDPESIPRGVACASVIESDIPVAVQHTRLDSRQSENALICTVAYAAA
jgi:hypothetical protein